MKVSPKGKVALKKGAVAPKGDLSGMKKPSVAPAMPGETHVSGSKRNAPAPKAMNPKAKKFGPTGLAAEHETPNEDTAMENAAKKKNTGRKSFLMK